MKPTPINAKPTQIIDDVRAALDVAQDALERAVNGLASLNGYRSITNMPAEVDGAKGPHVVNVIAAAQGAAVAALARTLDGQGGVLLVAKLCGMLTVDRIAEVLPVDQGNAGIVDPAGDDPHRRR